MGDDDLSTTQIKKSLNMMGDFMDTKYIIVILLILILGLGVACVKYDNAYADLATQYNNMLNTCICLK